MKKIVLLFGVLSAVVSVLVCACSGSECPKGECMGEDQVCRSSTKDCSAYDDEPVGSVSPAAPDGGK